MIIRDGTGKDEIILGGLDSDVITGVGGNDLIVGGQDGDTFVYNGFFGHDTIHGFEDGWDKIDLSLYAQGSMTFGKVQKHSAQVEDDVVIDLSPILGPSRSITIEGFHLDALTADDFKFFIG